MRLRALLRSSFEEALDALFPPVCHLCAAPLTPLTLVTTGTGARTPESDGWSCAQHRLPRRPPGPRCGRCARALAPALPDGYACAVCRARSPRFGRLDVLFDYRDSEAGRAWVLAFKHGGRADLARPLGAALGLRLRELHGAALDGALLVPVPLHPLRHLERGYDQARLLAEQLALELALEVAPLLERRRATAVQGAPGSPPRRANVEGAFRATGPLARLLRPPRARRILLVDDVVTSGATLDACAGALARRGARAIDAVALARAG